MTGITYGVVLTVTGILGAIGCITGLIVTAVAFPRQRKTMLEKIESE